MSDSPVDRTSKTSQDWHRANAVEVPDAPEMIDHPGDTVSKFVVVSNGFVVGRARWHYPTKSWCHKGDYKQEIIFWSELPSWVSTAPETCDGPGTPLYRLTWLLDQLAKRFPDAHNPIMSDPAEPKYMAAIDGLIGSLLAAGVAQKAGASQAPIANLIIDENGEICAGCMYAPGLPPGAHDVYLDPAAPGLKAHIQARCICENGTSRIDCPVCGQKNP